MGEANAEIVMVTGVTAEEKPCYKFRRYVDEIRVQVTHPGLPPVIQLEGFRLSVASLAAFGS